MFVLRRTTTTTTTVTVTNVRHFTRSCVRHLLPPGAGTASGGYMGMPGGDSRRSRYEQRPMPSAGTSSSSSSDHPKTMGEETYGVDKRKAVGLKDGTNLAVLQRTLGILRKTHPLPVRDTFNLMMDIAEIHASTGKHELAKATREDAVGTLVQALGPDTPDADLAKALSTLAGTYRTLGETESELSTLRYVIWMSTELFGSDHMYVGVNSLALARALIVKLNKADDAMGKKEKDEIRQECRATLNRALRVYRILNHPECNVVWGLLDSLDSASDNKK
eukprot:PhM_4_TR5788/c0_g1_i2/m.79669